MSNPVELFNDFSSRGIKLWAESGTLKFKINRGKLAPVDRAILKSNKAELLALLTPKPCQRCAMPMLHIEAGYYSCTNCFYQVVEARSGFFHKPQTDDHHAMITAHR